jgi:hypothetical protein
MSIDEKTIYIRPCASKNSEFDMFYEENGFNKKEPAVDDVFQLGCSYRSRLIDGVGSEKSLQAILQDPNCLKELQKLYTHDAAILVYKILSVAVGTRFHCVHKNINWICEKISSYYYDPTKAHPPRFLAKIIDVLDINEHPSPPNPPTYFTK